MAKTLNKSTMTKMTGDMHTKFLEHCYNGGSTNEFCRSQRISRTTFETWCDKYPHMAEAKKMGKVWAEGWWLSQARENLLEYKDSPKINANTYKFIVSGRFGHTSDRALADRITSLEQKLGNVPEKPATAYAEEADYVVDEDYVGLTSS